MNTNQLENIRALRRMRVIVYLIAIIACGLVVGIGGYALQALHGAGGG